MRTFTFTIKEGGKETWKGQYDLNDNETVPEGGLVLKNLTHEGYNFAKSIGVVKIWIDEIKPLTLGPTDFEDAEVKLEKTNVTNPPFQFGEYPEVFSMKVVYKSREPVIEGGSKLKVTQTFIFTKYSDTPAHEPSGNLMATRIFPLVKFSFVNDVDRPPYEDSIPLDKRVNSIRFDYLIEYNLDVFLHGMTIEESFKNSSEKRYPTEDEIKSIKLNPQQAGVFRDKDFLTSDIIKSIFIAAEKPLLSQIASYGLKRGKSVENRKTTTWDNIHWWGGYKKSHIPSAPGAFHAAHLHWRWGKFLQEHPGLLAPFGFGPLKQAGKKQFRNDQVIGGPLIDPSIPDQDIEFAIVKSDINLSIGTEKFIECIKSKINNKVEISQGSNIKLYMSYKTYRSPNSLIPFTGTFSISGIFFAHEKESESIFGFIPDTKKEEYTPKKPVKPYKIDRTPNDLYT